MKIAAVDIETTDLKALFGRVLCCSFHPISHPKKKDAYTFRWDYKPYRQEDPLDDSLLCERIRQEVDEYHMIVTWNGKQFDVPFLNARLIKAGYKKLSPQFHLDLMYYAGGISMRVGSRKLDNVQKYLGLAESKTDIDWDTWQRAGMPDKYGKEAMKEVVTHCEQDVRVLADAYHIMLPLVANLHR